jgi:hypothetical protein
MPRRPQTEDKSNNGGNSNNSMVRIKWPNNIGYRLKNFQILEVVRLISLLSSEIPQEKTSKEQIQFVSTISNYYKRRSACK